MSKGTEILESAKEAAGMSTEAIKDLGELTFFEETASFDPLKDATPSEFTMSLTRIPGGQTVPDEGGPGFRE